MRLAALAASQVALSLLIACLVLALHDAAGPAAIEGKNALNSNPTPEKYIRTPNDEF